MTPFIYNMRKLNKRPIYDLTSTLTDDPLDLLLSAAQGEQLVKLLQLLAGDVETNPGPQVSAPRSSAAQTS